MEPGR